jgi:ABC-type oligopeptide transport system ATPase subunit
VSALFETVGVGMRFRLRRDRTGRRRTIDALSDVNLVWNEGETLALVGESGSGKSTLGRVLLGLLQPTSGTVHYRGTPLPRRGLRKFRREVQVVFQDPYQSLNPRKTIGTQVLAGLEIHGIGSTKIDRIGRGLAALEAAGLTPAARFWERFPHELSGGQRQRAVIASAIVLDPTALVCDEPVSALDVSVRAQVLQLLADLRERQRLSLLFITHDVGLARQMSDRVVVLYQGRVVEQGATAAVLDDPQHDYTKALLAAVPKVRAAKSRP